MIQLSRNVQLEVNALRYSAANFSDLWVPYFPFLHSLS